MAGLVSRSVTANRDTTKIVVLEQLVKDCLTPFNTVVVVSVVTDVASATGGN